MQPFTEVFIIAWTGGYEVPQFEAKRTEEEARAVYAKWKEDSTKNPDDGDTFDIIRVFTNDWGSLEIEGLPL